MNYFITDIKSMVRSTSFQLLFFVSAVVMILDPITMYFVLGNSKGYFEELGTNFYRHWILMNYSWGNRLFCSLFLQFRVFCLDWFIIMNKNLLSGICWLREEHGNNIFCPRFLHRY